MVYSKMAACSVSTYLNFFSPRRMEFMNTKMHGHVHVLCTMLGFNRDLHKRIYSDVFGIHPFKIYILWVSFMPDLSYFSMFAWQGRKDPLLLWWSELPGARYIICTSYIVYVFVFVFLFVFEIQYTVHTLVYNALRRGTFFMYKVQCKQCVKDRMFSHIWGKVSSYNEWNRRLHGHKLIFIFLPLSVPIWAQNKEKAISRIVVQWKEVW
jgi:hypothetical protein